MTDLPVLDRSSLPEIAALCRRAIANAPTMDELEGTLFAPDWPSVVRGDPATGIVATGGGEYGGHMKLLVVDPTARGRGLGHTLVRAAHDDARAAGYPSITTGADAPYFLWPGVPTTEIALLALLERHHYARVEANFDMTIDLNVLPEDTGGHSQPTPSERDEIEAFMTTHWANWHDEVMRAFDKGNLVIARDDNGVCAFCAFEVNRSGFLGPVAARPDLIGKGAATPALLGALHELRRRGGSSIDVVWVGPIVPYARFGGRVTSVYFVYRKELQ